MEIRSNVLLRIIIIVIFSSVAEFAVLNSLNQLNLLSIIVLLCANSILASSELVYELYVVKKEEIMENDIFKDYIVEIKDFFTFNTEIDLEYQIEYYNHYDYGNLISKLLEKKYGNNIRQNIVNNIILLFYVDQYEVKENHDVYALMNSYINKIGIDETSVNGRRFLSIYGKYKDKIKIVTVDEFGRVDNKINIDNMRKIFCQKYYKEAWAVFFKALGRSEQLRNILIDIINGEISLHGVNIDLKEEYDKFLKSQNINAKSFLVIGNYIGQARFAFKKEIPFIHSGVKAYNFTKNELMMTLFIIKSERINSEDDVYELFNEHLKDKYYLCVIPVDFSRSKNYISHEIGEFETSFMNECSMALNYLRTGNVEEDIDIWNFFTQQNIGVDYLLSSIPFTIYVDDITEEEQRILISKYELIKNNFRVTKLNEWKRINIKDLSDYMYQVYNLESKITKKRTYEIARKIKNSAIDYGESIKPIDLTI